MKIYTYRGKKHTIIQKQATPNKKIKSGFKKQFLLFKKTSKSYDRSIKVKGLKEEVPSSQIRRAKPWKRFWGMEEADIWEPKKMRSWVQPGRWALLSNAQEAPHEMKDLRQTVEKGIWAL